MNRVAPLVAGAAVVALCGCDKLFDLQEISARGDGGSDGVIDGAAVDAFVCQPVNHDEDTDTVDDGCDPCPTFAAGGNSTDTDTDGLPDECDRNDAPSAADRVLAYWTFPTSQLAGFVTSGVLTYMATNNGMWNVGGNASMTTVDSFALTRVDFHVSGVTTAGDASELQVQIGTNTLCRINGDYCDGTSGGTCLRFGAGNSAPWPQPSSAARRISLYRVGTNVQCSISDGTNSVNVGAPASLFPGSIGVVLNATASVRVEAIVVYGEK